MQGLRAGAKGQEMIPWNKQQFWFWLSAILIVSGAATMLRENHPTQVVHRNQAIDSEQVQIIRRRDDLPDSSHVPQVAEGLTPAEERLLVSPQSSAPQASVQREQQDSSVSHFHNQFSTINKQGRTRSHHDLIQQADYPQSEALQRPALIAPTIFQASVGDNRLESTTKPIVWFAGSIEKIND